MELTRDRMREYLRNSNRLDCTLRICYTTIVQKSYGIEKRFFVPAPIISLEGNGWVNKMRELQRFYEKQAKQREIDVSILPPPTIEGTIAVHEVSDHPVLNFELNNSAKSFVARTLYVRHTENRNYLQMAVELKYNNGCRLGTFTTDRIKVISKASKAKNSTGSIDFKYLAVSSGQEICLSNRPKAPPITRFITGEKDKFSCSATNWTPLTIHLVDTSKSPGDDLQFCVKDGAIRYGDIVRLVDKHTGMSLPCLRICKVNKDKVVFPTESPKDSEREVVNQMQKVVLQMTDEKDFTYIQLENNGVTLKTMERKPKDKDAKMHEAALFTICCTTELEYTFYEAMGQTMYDIFPAPICVGISLDTLDMSQANVLDDLTVFIAGKNFTDNLSVWFGTVVCDSFVRGAELIEFTIPSLKSVADETIFRSFVVAQNKFKVPITLVRDDGVIFSTGLTFIYLNAKLENNHVDF